MNQKLLNTGVTLISAGTVGILLAIVMEIRTAEPVYFIVMKATAILFGVGGPLVGWAIARRKK